MGLITSNSHTTGWYPEYGIRPQTTPGRDRGLSNHRVLCLYLCSSLRYGPSQT
jgi:hypothetical protein